MSIATELARIKAAKASINNKLAAMGLTSSTPGTISDSASLLQAIEVQNVNSADDIFVEDGGTDSATYNLYKGYYPNDFYLPHPDSVGDGGETAELQATINSLNAELKSIENQLKEI